jgi:rhamnosyltransferase
MYGKIAACVVLYNPDQSVEKNILSYINYVGKVYVIDNTETKYYDFRFSSAIPSEITFIHDGRNEGIAKRLNQACTLAINEGFEGLLTMDQDSYFDGSSIRHYLQCIENFHKKEQVSMFGVNYENQTQKESCDFINVKSLITSGSVINLNSYKQIGEFDENLFIDFVDTEYCFNSVQKGYAIIQFPNIFMHHEIGTVSQQRSLKNLKKSSRSIHSASRLYYMTRNLLYLNKKYKHRFKKELSVHKKDLINRIKNKLLYSKNRYQTLQYLLKAYNNYRNNKMGRQF